MSQHQPSPYEDQPEMVVRKEDARDFFTPRLKWRNPRMKVKAIRALLALYHGGKCNFCGAVLENYWDTYRWHFDHLADLQDYTHSPRTGIKQFRISGNAAANHRFATVIRHGMDDTQLLCKNCHYLKNRETYMNRQAAATGITHLVDRFGLG